MQIAIKYKPSVSLPNIIVRGRCQHVNTDTEDVVSTYFSAEADGPVENLAKVEVCSRILCVAYRYLYSGDWENDFDVE